MEVSRIQKAYERQFRALLQQARARRLEQGVQWLLARARELSLREGIPLTGSIARVYERVAAKPSFKKAHSSGAPPLFFCDAGLGGLARWLRAAGHDAKWQPDIDDEELLRQARKLSATILTTDSMLMERRLLRDRIIPALWLPPTLKISEQLEKVFCEFDLSVGTPRCMSCGGELRPATKESLRDRIPPRTYRWLDEYFLCCCCGK